MIRVDIESIMMANGPMPSLVVLREREGSAHADSPLRALSIQTGAFEAAAIGKGIDGDVPARPITHDLLLNAVESLGARVERVEISRMDAPVFYATVVLEGGLGSADGGGCREQRGSASPVEGGREEAGCSGGMSPLASSGEENAVGEIKIDARPSDALALAVRSNAPIYVEDDVMNRAGSAGPATSPQDPEHDLDSLDDLIQNLTPDDF